MKRIDRIKLNFTRHWNIPGKERLLGLFKISAEQQQRLQSAITWLVNEDIAIYVDTGSYIEWSILSAGTYEGDIAKLIQISLRPGDTALDIGMNIGLQSMRMARAVGEEGFVLGFEPLEHIREKAYRNLQLNRIKNVRIFPYALSDSAGEAEFAIDKRSWNQGAFSLDGAALGTERQNVYIKVGDELSEIQQLECLRLIKIDVEGFEFNVLKGLKQTLEKHRPRLLFEFDQNYWSRSTQDIGVCFSFLNAMGYTIYQITQVGCELIRHASEMESGNFFCVQDNEY